MKKICLAIFFIIFNFIIFYFTGYALEKTGEELKLYLGENQVISVNNPTRIVVGNPGIADIAGVTKTDIIIIPKAAGKTTLVFWDNFGEQSYQIKVFAENINEIKLRVDNLLEKLNLPQVYTKAEEKESRVFLLGRVKTASDRERITTALGTLKEKIVDLVEIKEDRAVVDIAVNVLELNRDATKTLGFTWPGAITLTDASGPTAAAVTGLKQVFHVSDFTRSAFNVTLDALIQEGKARVLSRPRLSCQSGKEAQLLVGGEKPILTTQVTTGIASTTNVEYKEYGIKLKIKPTVDEEDRIKLVLNVEVSDIGAAETIGDPAQPTAKAYPLSKRNASTELYIDNGQTIAIGGLIREKNEEDLRKFPWLSEVPVLGVFFRQRTIRQGGGSGERGNTELFITLTPTIISKETAEGKQASSSLGIPQQQVVTFETKGIPANLVGYMKAVQTKIINATYYPREAKDAGWEGSVKLSLNITSQGDLKDVKILESSGYKILDDAAVDVTRTQTPYPPFPPQIDSQEIWVDVPIVYQRN